MFSLNEVGALVDGTRVTFSVYLPSVASPSFSAKAYFIRQEDQFDKNTPATPVDLQPVSGADTWGEVNKGLWRGAASDLEPGRYLYRYEIVGPKKTTGERVRSLYFGDPFARETSSGVFSSFTVGGDPFVWNEDANFRVPAMKDAIIYEADVAEFNHDFDGLTARVPYLKSLGINVLELLPITGVTQPFDWGYTPVFYFAPEERFGGPTSLKRLVQECHRAGIALVLDLVCPHADRVFPYGVAYDPFFHLWRDDHYLDPATAQIMRAPNPIVSEYARFGNKNDFRMKSTQEFFKAVCCFWIEQYHVDGFRYDHVNGLLDHHPGIPPDWDRYRPTFDPLKDLTKHVYACSKDFPRFRDGSGASRVIQIAEDLNQGPYQLSDGSGSGINGCWEEGLYHASTDMALWKCLNGDYVNELLQTDSGRWGSFAGTKRVGGEEVSAQPILYNNCHDKSFLMYRLEKRAEWDPTGYDYPAGLEHLRWYRLQPYAIALLTGVGTPMLWAGEEFAEAYGLPSDGPARVRGARFLHWDYFYTPQQMPDALPVLPLTVLYRNLCRLRKESAALRGPRGDAKKELEDFEKKVVVYRRWSGGEVVVVALNFSDEERTVEIPFGHVGRWVDVLHAMYPGNAAYVVSVADPAGRVGVQVPSNFGRLFRLGPA